MELKGQARLHKRGPSAVSIAPLWNWKSSRPSRWRCRDGFNRTFMELKEFSVYSKGRSKEFQSHLYGIESRDIVCAFCAYRVSIAPLWNWKFGRSLLKYRCSCFNRTFMELKVLRPSYLLTASRFQSHLYGIERSLLCRHKQEHKVSIAPLWNWKSIFLRLSKPLQGFNRTFMELKESNKTFETNLRKFQSHLYGIESCCALRYFTTDLVSIAPLWNWKLVAQLYILLRIMFQSHLYGIERLVRVYILLGVMFQSHLYGIESLPDEWCRMCGRVSIAPLWNWKWGEH